MTADQKKPGRNPDVRMVGTFTVDTPPPVTFTNVNATLFNSDGNNTSGGFLQGRSQPWKAGREDAPEIILGFSAARAGAGNPQIFQYPSDFHEPYVRWVYIDQQGKRHSASTGTITVEFGNNFGFFRGTYSFVNMEDKTISGSFDIGYVK
ncbi:hypothetical protein [Pseudomonas sp. FP2300]|uniref:hypothetical protein n=1 Tax=Pseudomonas sp. FP2300 TaxID=2954090 RepID=UPI0027365C1F|nr:hypothetical protein [Pseudomonas sp. FP2300]WLH63052.1 hypothetical protein PSH86_00425 [Pseudomonas sp. FP2300]